ncbi:MAG: hypothetical protein HOP28_18600 [Gemmatimonadales bacterium]|nr:hypothetical protein [Gemmatimonadales bacterium]
MTLVALAGLLGPGCLSAQAGKLALLERAWLALRNDQDELRMTESLGLRVSPAGTRVDSLAARIRRGRERVATAAAQVVPESLAAGDRSAFLFLRDEIAALVEPGSGGSPDSPAPGCANPHILTPGTRDTLAALRDQVFACYGAAAQRVIVDGDTLDRLTVLGLLGRTEDRSKRERLFKGLLPVWQSVNGDDAAASPYRKMLRLRVRSWAGGPTPMEERALGLGVHPDTLERWLLSVLEGWRATLPDTLLEPWDFYFYNGEASRLLSPLVPKDSLLPLNRRFYKSLGADPKGLGVRYEIEPRQGKYPVAFTDIARRTPMTPWVSASYRIGGLDNLSELLHETGHAIHIAAIKTRPAYADWPDSDTFTEAIADIAALEMYEPAWQRKFLGRAAPLSASIRAKYAGIAMDVAWSLFEIRVHRTPDRSPNQIWSELTREYLKIRPHPEWSWWAMRGQLVDAPGYMLNYAFGAILIADIRAKLLANQGAFTTGNPTWYAWTAPRLLRFGRERAARAVVEEFLGRAVQPRALLADLKRGS